jgi:hypothetical protein
MFELVSIDEQLRVIDDQIATCNIDADKSSYFSLLSNKQALQQRKDEIRTQFAR